MAATIPENQKGILILGEEYWPNDALMIENYMDNFGLTSSVPDISKMWYLGSSGVVEKHWLGSWVVVATAP